MIFLKQGGFSFECNCAFLFVAATSSASIIGLDVAYNGNVNTSAVVLSNCVLSNNLGTMLLVVACLSILGFSTLSAVQLAVFRFSRVRGRHSRRLHTTLAFLFLPYRESISLKPDSACILCTFLTCAGIALEVYIGRSFLYYTFNTAVRVTDSVMVNNTGKCFS